MLTGEAAVTLGATNQGMVAGDLVNTASRLQSVAAAGTVLVGEATWRARLPGDRLRASGRPGPAGQGAPVPAWRALRVVAGRGGRNRSDALEAPFVGRDEELRALKDLYAATSRERPSPPGLVIGPAGIGKTRLAWEFTKYLDGLADPVWWHAGRSPAYGDGITFWALGEMVRGRAGLAEGDDEATTRARIAETVRTHVADPAEQRWIEPALLALLGVETGIGSDELFAAWRTFFERLADTAPVVLVFEDLQHADPGLLDFIDHVMEWSRGVPITLIALARPELLERRSDWGAGLRAFTSIHLEPLPPADMERLLAGPRAGAARAGRPAIVARADGVAPVRGRDRADAPRPGTPGARGRGVPAGAGPSTRSRCPRPSRPSSPRASTASTLPTGPWSPMPRSWARASAPRPSRRSRGPARPSSPPGSGVSSGGSCSRSTSTPARPGAASTPSSRPWSARSPTTRSRGATAGSATSPRPGISRPWAPRRSRGRCADHVQAAYRNTPPGPEADALAAQARTTLRAAATRATALGAHAQALAFLEQALEVTTDPADRAALHASALAAADEDLDLAAVERHAEAAVLERRRTGDRAAIARAIGEWAYLINTSLWDPARSLAIASEAWEEFSDLEQTPAGVALMAAARVVVPGSRRHRPSDVLVRPAPADRGAARAARGDGGGHPRTGRGHSRRRAGPGRA